MKINLSKTSTYMITEPVIMEFNEITITLMLDLPNEKKVFVNTIEIGQILLWEGDQYDQIGQWTDEDIISAIKLKFDPDQSVKKGKKK